MSLSEHFRDVDVVLYRGDALDVLHELEDDEVDACVTSPPYLDARPEYPSIAPDALTAILEELRRVVYGTLVVNVGRLFRDGVESLWWLELLDAAASAGWKLRDTLIWIKPNANPIIGPILANSHEYVFLFGDGFDTDSVRRPYAPGSLERLGRRWISNVSVKGDTSERNGKRRDEKRGQRLKGNALGARGRSYVEIYVGREKGNRHPAPMPLELAGYLVGLSGGGVILDPFAGSGTTLLAARNRGAMAIGIERDAAYCDMIAERLGQQSLLAG